jgi:signal peptidase
LRFQRQSSGVVLKRKKETGNNPKKSSVNSRILKRVLGGLSALLLILVVILSIGVLVAPQFGWRFDAVLSGSMEPAINVGGIVVIRPVAPSTIRDGDIITFVSSGGANTVVTHRVVQVADDKGSPVFYTKGDANEASDSSLVQAKDVVGKVWLSVPYAGYVVDFIQKPVGFGLIVGLPALLIIIWETRNIIVSAKDIRRKERQKRVLASRRKLDVKAQASQGLR